MKILNALILPKEMSDFERRYLARVNRIGLGFFALHVPVFVLVAYFNDTKPLHALLLTAAVLVGPILAQLAFENPRMVSVSHGFTAMLMGGLLVHFGQGPVQIEMHFYFFALLAMLAMYGNPMVIVVAAVTVALHHLALWAVLPQSVFNYDAPIWVVIVHAAFVVLESVATCFIARSFFDNVIGLERIIQVRTHELDARNQDMRLVLDHVGQGFLTLDEKSIVSREKSSILDQWLGVRSEGATFADYLENVAPAAADSFRFGWEQVVDQVLPLELTLDQLPKAFTSGGSCFEIAYSPVGGHGQLSKVLVVISDVTARMEQERLEAEQREMLSVVGRVMHDKAGFLEFYEDADLQVAAIVADRIDDPTVLARTIHTLKGNSSIFGIQTIASMCHDLEDAVLEGDAQVRGALLIQLGKRWQRIQSNLETLLGGGGRSHVELDETEYAAISGAIHSGASRQKIAEIVARWKLEPTSKRLVRVADQAQGIARRLNKDGVQLKLANNGLYLDPKRWAPFWASFIHVVRNAIDHGIEPSDQRMANGKPATGTLSLETRVEGEDFVIEIADDGRGVDWHAVEAKARSLGLPCKSQRDLEEALFRDGLTTSQRVNEFSGRGVGMGAVRSACADRGGRVHIASSADGTSVQFRFPKREMAPEVRSVRRMSA
jgi:two-component system, chemotaxis family, sensor kinase CheA